MLPGYGVLASLARLGPSVGARHQKVDDRGWQLVITLLEPVTDEPAAPRATRPSVVPESPPRLLLAS